MKNIKMIPIENLEIDKKLTKHLPDMSSYEFISLVEDIKTNGQIEPITVVNNTIIDGRQRYRALIELGIRQVMVEVFPDNTTLKQKKQIVNSKEIRRMLSITQKTCMAVEEWYKEKPNMVQKEFCKIKGISYANFQNANYIYKHKRMVIKPLICGEKYKLSSNTGATNYTTTDSLRVIVADIKKADDTKKDKEVEHKGLDFFDKRINKLVNYHFNNLLEDIDNLNISDVDKAVIANDIATQIYSMYKTKFGHINRGNKTIVGSKIITTNKDDVTENETNSTDIEKKDNIENNISKTNTTDNTKNEYNKKQSNISKVQKLDILPNNDNTDKKLPKNIRRKRKKLLTNERDSLIKSLIKEGHIEEDLLHIPIEILRHL